MPKGKTGNPRGRPPGTRNEQLLSEDAIYYALFQAFRMGIIPFGDKPEYMENRATGFAKLLANPESQVTQEETDGWVTISFAPPERLGDEQFENSVQNTIQRRNGTKGENHYLDGEGGLYILEAGGYVADVLAAQSPSDAFRATMTLRSLWDPRVTIRLYWLSLALQMARTRSPLQQPQRGNY